MKFSFLHYEMGTTALSPEAAVQSQCDAMVLLWSLTGWDFVLAPSSPLLSAQTLPASSQAQGVRSAATGAWSWILRSHCSALWGDPGRLVRERLERQQGLRVLPLTVWISSQAQTGEESQDPVFELLFQAKASIVSLIFPPLILNSEVNSGQLKVAGGAIPQGLGRCGNSLDHLGNPSSGSLRKVQVTH